MNRFYSAMKRKFVLKFNGHYFFLWISILILPLPKVMKIKIFEDTTGISDSYSYLVYSSIIILFALYFIIKLLKKLKYIVTVTPTRLIFLLMNI